MFGKSASKFQEKSSNTIADKESLSVDLPEYVVKRKSIFKCRICPRIVCLNEEALRAHVKSKVRCVHFYLSFWNQIIIGSSLSKQFVIKIQVTESFIVYVCMVYFIPFVVRKIR